MTSTLMLSTLTFSDFLWLILAFGLISAFIGPILINAWRASRPSTGAATDGGAEDSSGGGPRVIVNIPADLKAIAPLPGDTSIEGQRAVLWFNVYREAVEAFTQDGFSPLTAMESEYAMKAANEAVDSCYREGNR